MMRRFICLIFLTGCFTGILLGENLNITKIGEWGTGYYSDVFVQNNYAYCAAGYAGLDIIDIRKASNPQRVGNYDTPDKAKKVYVTGNYAYVADSREGLQIIDVSNPSSPVLVGNYNKDHWDAEAVFV
ncbi:MAG: hypothetical protein JSV88_23795, partial [Candidatus Aminicenantes bacterium]